jgi:hypothetical protein
MEKIRKTLMIELALCETKRDVARVFDAAETDIRNRQVPKADQHLVFKEIEKKLPILLAHDARGQLVEEARSHIQRILGRN